MTSTEISLLQSSIAATQEQRNTLLQRLLGDSRELLSLLFGQVFSNHPQLQLISWSQFEGEYEDDGPYPGLNPHSVVYKDAVYNSYVSATDEVSVAITQIMQQARQALHALPSEAVYQLFGTYNWVVATRSGIETLDEYDLYERNIDWMLVASEIN